MGDLHKYVIVNTNTLTIPKEYVEHVMALDVIE